MARPIVPRQNASSRASQFSRLCVDPQQWSAGVTWRRERSAQPSREQKRASGKHGLALPNSCHRDSGPVGRDSSLVTSLRPGRYRQGLARPGHTDSVLAVSSTAMKLQVNPGKKNGTIERTKAKSARALLLDERTYGKRSRRHAKPMTTGRWDDAASRTTRRLPAPSSPQ